MTARPSDQFWETLAVRVASFMEMLPDGLYVLISERYAYLLVMTPGAYWRWP